MKILIKQQLRTPTARQVDAFENLLVLLPTTASDTLLRTLPYGDTLVQRRAETHATAAPESPFVTDLPNVRGTRLALGSIALDASTFQMLTLGRKLAALVLEQNPRQVHLLVVDFGETSVRLTEVLLAALLAAVADMPSYKRKPAKTKRLEAITVYGLPGKLDLHRAQAEADGNTLARYLTTLPPNELTPAHYRRRIATLAREHGWHMEFLDMKALARKKSGAFLAVAQGSADTDAGVVHLRYEPKTKNRKRRLALVGKGICFDTGGHNLKSAKSMHGMHEDMAGSAVALGTLLALTQLKVDFRVDCWLALAQNHIGPKAYKQNDVVRAIDGTSIEVVHTDAEGRMVLADTLALARREAPQLMIDYATLTGACVYALGTTYSGVFSNREALNRLSQQAGQASGERVWPFPMDADYDEALESTIADVKQCILEGEADHILGARFLNRFVGDTPWLHVDLASANHKGGLAHIPTDITGFGVRFTLNLLLEQGALTASL